MCQCGNAHQTKSSTENNKTKIITLLKQRDALRILVDTDFNGIEYCSAGTSMNELLKTVEKQIESEINNVS